MHKPLRRWTARASAAFSPALALTSALTFALLFSAGSARAGMFDDEEARKAIIDLRSRVTALEDQGKNRSAELAASNAALTEQVAAMRRSLLDLNNQLEAMRADIAKQRGSGEQLARDVADVQQRQRDIGQGLDERLRKLEPAKVALDGSEFNATRDEREAYEQSISAIRGGDFDKAVSMLSAFQTRYPSSGFADSVRFWMGNAQYGKRDYKGAIASFRAFVSAAPDHPRAPEALLALANSQAETKDPRAARRTIDELMKSYPNSDAAKAGKERLASLK